MDIAIGFVIVGVMAITLGAAVFTNVQVWGLVRASRTAIRKLPPERRRRIRVYSAAIYAVVLDEAAIVVTAPYGVR
jgi:hypothetical protein